MLNVRPILILPALVLPALVLAQPPNDDCNAAATLCADQPLTGNNTGAVGWPGFCGSTANVVWYSFTTNSVGGVVNVSVSGITCPGVAGMDNELSVVVLSGDGSCTPGSFSAASQCEQDSVDFTAASPALQANTQYWVIVAGVANNGALIPAQCGFTIATSGPGADIVGVDFSAGQDVILADGNSVQLQATGGTTYQWSPSSGLSSSTGSNPFAEPNESTTYTVETTINGCVFTDDVFVEVRRLIDPPNTITPNGDGKNDVWEIFGIRDYPECDVSIYDRWGQRVFHNVGYREAFDGKDLPTATYYWVIDLNTIEGRSDPYTGYLTIVN